MLNHLTVTPAIPTNHDSHAAGGTASPLTDTSPKKELLKGNIRHAVCRWVYEHIPLDEFCIAVKKAGITAIDMPAPEDWPVIQRHGLQVSMCNGAEINLTDGWNDPRFHDQLIQNYTAMIPRVAAAGYQNLICFSGNRRGMDDATGMANCVTGLRQILPLAQEHGVTLVMELLNSRVDHIDYQCDKTAWGVALARELDSPHFKLLYDIYHMQIDEGDIIRNIRENHTWFAHYHTGGVPGRHEIDNSQELYYPAIMKAIVATGFTGYVAQEFIPSAADTAAQLDALSKAVQICDV